MNKQVANILSAIFFGVFIAPLVSSAWILIPALNDFPIGDGSPYGIGLPLGFCLGVVMASYLNRRWRWGRAGAISGGILLFIAIVCSLATVTAMMGTKGWAGLGYLVAFIFCLHGVVAALGLMLSAILSQKCA